MDSEGTDANCHTDIGGRHGPGTSILQLDHGQPEGNQRRVGKISHYTICKASYSHPITHYRFACLSQNRVLSS